MSKAKSAKAKAKSNSRTPMIVAAVVVVVALILVALKLTSSPASSATQSISPSAYQQQFINGKAPHTLIDVRTAEEFASGYIAGAINIPVDVIADHLSEIPRDKPVIIYCRSGNRSKQAAQILAQAGYTDIRDLGGINAWSEQGLPVTQ